MEDQLTGSGGPTVLSGIASRGQFSVPHPYNSGNIVFAAHFNQVTYTINQLVCV